MGIKTPWNRDRPRSDPTVVGAVARFALGGLIALAVVGVISFFVTKDIGRSEALKHAREVTRIVGRGIVEPHLTRGLIRGDPEALAGFDRIVRRRVLQDPIVRVKLWTQSGRLAYSDEPRLIGRRYPLGSDEVASLQNRRGRLDISDLSLPENRYERGRGDLLEVYLPCEWPAGGAAALRGLPAIQFGRGQRQGDLACLCPGSAGRIGGARTGAAPPRLLDGKPDSPR